MPDSGATRIAGALSKEAIAYLENGGPVIRPPDLENSAALTRFRDLMDKSGATHLANCPFTFDLADETVAGVPVLRMSVSEKPDSNRILLHIHGGGFVVGSPRGNASLPLQVAHAMETACISVDYRLAPEHPFPAALDDVRAVYLSLARQFGADRIGVLGESAGGGLAISLALALRDAGDEMPGAIAAIAPFADLTGSGESMQSNRGIDPDLDWQSLGPGASAYAGDRDLQDPNLSPVFADLAGLPPLLIQVGSRDVLLSDSVTLAANAEASGVDVSIEVWEGLWHCFHFDPGLPEARQACDRIGTFLNDRLDR